MIIEGFAALLNVPGAILATLEVAKRLRASGKADEAEEMEKIARSLAEDIELFSQTVSQLASWKNIHHYTQQIISIRLRKTMASARKRDFEFAADIGQNTDRYRDELYSVKDETLDQLSTIPKDRKTAYERPDPDQCPLDSTWDEHLRLIFDDVLDQFENLNYGRLQISLKSLYSHCNTYNLLADRQILENTGELVKIMDKLQELKVASNFE